MKTKKLLTLSAGVLATVTLSYAVMQYVLPASGSEKVRAGDDFYQYVNGDWLKKTKIPNDSPSYGVVDEMTEKIDKRLKADVKKLVSGKEVSNLEGMDEFISFYKVATDFEQIEKDGTKPAQAYLEEIENLSSLSDLKAVAKEWTLRSLPLPFTLAVSVNAEKTDEKMIELSSPSSILPDVSLYQDKETKKQLLSVYQKGAIETLERMGYSEKEAKKRVEGALAFDALIVPYLLSSEEASDIKSMINPRTAEEVAAYTDVLNLADLAEELVGQDVEIFNVSTLKYYENISQILTEENFESLKSWLLVREALSDAAYLDEKTRAAASQYEMAVLGVTELPDKKDRAYQMAINQFSPVFSVYYGDKYFGKEAKDKVTEMIQNIIAVYKKRMAENTWLSEETKAKAVEKLEVMTSFVGYPEEVPQEIAIIDVDENKSLLANMADMGRVVTTYSFEHFNDPIDKTQWVAPSYQVNAFYQPTNNSITFPAAILEAPFYSEKQTTAENYGGIGSVIGHEITHAFDTNGALFDAQGNMANWWTEADFKAFEQRTKAMIKHFDGYKVSGGKVNGELTVTENTADAGGVSSALEVLKTVDPKADLKDFFENYAKINRSKETDAYAKFHLLDVHAPDKARVNLQVNVVPEFYETYQVKKGDKLYLPEAKRVKIW